MHHSNVKSPRLQSLDILRGLTVAGMILVNNGYGESFVTLQHSKWNGMTPCDLVFPFFLFIMGISCYLSLSKSQFTPSAPVLRKIVKRTVLLFVIGLFINWFHNALKGDPGLDHLRLWAVMQRIALCYLFVSLFALYINHRLLIPTIIVLLGVYTFLILVGNGYAEDASTNIVAQADLRLFGYDHLYHKSPVDPEGLLGTIPSIAHVLIGFFCGMLFKKNPTAGDKTQSLFVAGTVCIIAGYLLTFALPLNKRIWSPSYVLVTCGLATLLLALFIWLESRDTTRRFIMNSQFKVFGVNALALYVFSELLSILFSRFGINDAIYSVLHAVIPPLKWASVAYALTFVLINYALGYLLYRKKIFIKL